MTPDGADLHATHRLPDVLTIVNVAGSEELLTRARHDPLGDWRRFLINPHADPAQYREGEYDDRTECDPQRSKAHCQLLMPEATRSSDTPPASSSRLIVSTR